jgi:hypothetical protein
MKSEEIEELLRRAGRPAQPPERLDRAVLGGPRRPDARPWLRTWRGTAAVVAAFVLLGVLGQAVLRPAPTVLSRVELQGAAGASAEVRIGRSDGANRSIQLSVQHLGPGAEGAYELWSLAEKPPMLLATFMTHDNGACLVAFSVPRPIQVDDLVITPHGQADRFILCSNPGRCPRAATRVQAEE